MVAHSAAALAMAKIDVIVKVYAKKLTDDWIIAV
jgi:hypothetical protein